MKVIWWLTIGLFSIANILLGQEQFYKKYSMYDGLVRQQITCLHQDSRGYIWIGTKGGVSRFNGQDFISFRNLKGLIHPYIESIKEDLEGNIWISTRYGLSKYDGNKMESFQGDFGITNKIEIDHKNRIWVLHNSSNKNKTELQLSIFKNGELTSADNIIKSKIDSIQVFDILFDPINERILIACGFAGLFSFEDGKFNRIYFEENLRIVNIQDYVYGNSIGFRGNNKGQTAIFRLFEKNKVEQIEETEFVNQIIFDPDEKAILIKDSYSTLMKIEGDDEFELFKNIGSFSTVFFDRNNSLWIGSENGLYKIVEPAFSQPQQNLNENIWSIVEDREGKMWFGSLENGLQVSDGKILWEETGYQSITGFDRFYPGTILTSKGDLVFSMESYVVRYDGTSFHPIKLPNDTHINACQDIIEDVERDLLVMADYQGINIAYPNGEIKHFGINEGMHFHSYSSCVEIDDSLNYWIGTEQGLARFNVEEKSFKNYTSSLGSLPVNEIRTIERDRHGTLWFGSDNGILIYNRNTDEIQRMASSAINQPVSFILDYYGDFLIIGAVECLYLLDLKDFYSEEKLKFSVFNHFTGYHGFDPVLNGAFIDSKGTVWIPGRDGVIKFNPQKKLPIQTPLNTVITSINDQNIAYNSDSLFTLDYLKNELKIEYEAVGFNRPLQTQYAYFLENYSDNWTEWQSKAIAIFNNLGSGEYVFRVKSRSLGELENQQKEAKIICRVQLPFWKEPNFYMYALTTIAILCLLGVYFFFRQQMQKAKVLKNEQEIKYLRVQTLQAQMNPHFVFNVLGTLQNLILNSDTQKANDHLVKLSKLIRRFLDSSVKSDIPKNIGTEYEISLEKELELINMYIEFEQLQYENEFDYELNIDPKLNISILTIPPMIIQPFIENAIKHGLLPKKQKGKLEIDFFEADENLICIIRDNGIGRAKAAEIQKRSLQSYKSHGTSLVRKRIEILNEMGYKITITTKDSPSGGTEVKIKIGY